MGIFVASYTVTRTLSWFVLLAPWFVLYNYELLDFLTANSHWYVRDGSLSGINLLLANNLNKYHPFIFYTSVFLLVPPTCRAPLLYGQRLLFTVTQSLRLNERLLVHILLVNLFALFLGSWWALQEGTWGGWWNWDASEVLGLSVTLISLQYLHTSRTFTNLVQVNEKFGISLVIFILSYFFIQLNFDLVSHNFGSKFFFFFNNNLFFLEILVLLSLSIVANLGRIHFWRTQLLIILTLSRNPLTCTLRWVGVWVLYTLVSVTALSSFLPLLNYFIWSYLAINSFNFHLHLPLVITPLLVLFLLTFSSFNFTFLVIIISSASWKFTPSTLMVLLLLVPCWSLISVQHSLLVALLAVNLVSYTLNFVYWYPAMIHEEIPLVVQSTFIKQELLTCDVAFIDKLVLYQVGGRYNNVGSWNTFHNTNAPILNSFILGYDAGIHFNYYLLSDGWLSPALYIETGYLNNMLDIVTLLIVSVTLILLTRPNHGRY